MTQNEILFLGLAKAFAFPLAALAITAALYGATRLYARWTA